MYRNLIRFVEKTQRVAITHPLVELLVAAGAELVGLDPFLADHRRPHDAAVPVRTEAGASGG